MGLSRKRPLWKPISASVAGLDTIFLDETPIANFKAVKYIIQCAGSTLVKVVELTAANTSTGIKDIISSRMGDLLGIEINVVVVATDVFLRFENLESFEVDLEIKKIIL